MACITWVQKGLILVSAAGLYISWDLLQAGGEDRVGAVGEHYTLRREHVKQVGKMRTMRMHGIWPSPKCNTKIQSQAAYQILFGETE